MPRIVRASATYRNAPYHVRDDACELQEVDSNDHLVYVNLDAVVPIPEQARVLNWARILEHVPATRRRQVQELILEEYLDHFIDGDHRVTINDTDNVLRFVPSKFLSVLNIWRDLGALRDAVHRGQVSLAECRHALRALGTTLTDFSSVAFAGHHPIYTRELVEPATRDEAPRLFDDEVPYWVIQVPPK